jgi:hypothetical protein
VNEDSSNQLEDEDQMRKQMNLNIFIDDNDEMKNMKRKRMTIC